MHSPWLEDGGGGRPHGVREGSFILCLEASGGGGMSGELHATAAGSRGAIGTPGETVFTCMCWSCFHLALGSVFEPHRDTACVT